MKGCSRDQDSVFVRKYHDHFSESVVNVVMCVPIKYYIYTCKYVHTTCLIDSTVVYI